MEVANNGVFSGIGGAPAALSGLNAPLERLAFGSCNHQARDQPLCDPQLWIWMGDAIYGDYKALNELQTYLPPFPVFRDAPPDMLISKYTMQLEHPDYALFRQRVPIIGVWDDHDYGRNDGDKTYAYRAQSQEIFLDFLAEPIESTRRQQEGVYAAYTFGAGAQSVKVILLDVRYNKDPYGMINGDFLGDTQWAWLEQELRSSTAAFNLLVSGVQVLPADRFFGGENWHRFPKQRQRLLDLILTSNARGVLLMSGDVHFAELNQVACNDYKNILTEVTSSGMTHSWDKTSPWQSIMAMLFRSANAVLPWDYRPHHGAYYGLRNFGEIQFDWHAAPQPIAQIKIRGEDGSVKLAYNLSSHYLDQDAIEHPSERCAAIHESNVAITMVRRLFMLGVVGLLLGGVLGALAATAALIYLVFKRSFFYMMRQQRTLFDDGYTKFD
ncbi:hypothetical protein P43SY_009725 [Pythium insidiosum]|uniref:PhoD-like phosphatase metallophosphatase domain-containing protein n=1 Tax=Pythium insidiosum TaxID=114742 RepID=A0AAD5LLL1_PYTIN|nr:hypothetical protein P43SY_009725 [Pythium insidiosum]